jgi:FkbM family methyltransferase
MASLVPSGMQQELKRIHYRRQLKNGVFITDEPEFGELHQWISAGDWVIDIGANIGHYTCKLSQLVGPSGRVISVEPVPETFELLSANVGTLPCRNVTLLNVAASDKPGILGMNVPRLDTGLKNYYRANLTDGEAELKVFTLSLDTLDIPEAVRLVKVDVEGAELHALKGIASILERDHPVLIVEDNVKEVGDYLEEFAYVPEKLDGSPNIVFR